MRIIATFGAVVAVWPLGSWAGHPVAPSLPAGVWKLQVCLSEGYTTKQPCAYLDNRLILRVENPSGPHGEHGPVVFERHISQELAQRLYARALATIRSFNSTSGQDVLDGDVFSVTLTTTANTAEVKFGAIDVSKMSPAVRELNGLLREATHAF